MSGTVQRYHPVLPVWFSECSPKALIGGAACQKIPHFRLDGVRIAVFGAFFVKVRQKLPGAVIVTALQAYIQQASVQVMLLTEVDRQLRIRVTDPDTFEQHVFQGFKIPEVKIHDRRRDHGILDKIDP